MAKRRHRSQMRRERQSRQQKQIEAQLAELGGAALSQPILLVASGGHVTASRAMPEVLEGHMDDSSWNSFCDEIDEALLPLGKIRRDMKLWCLLPLSIFVPLVLLGFVAHCLMASRLTGDEGSKLDLLPMILFSIAFAGSISLALGAARLSSRRRARVNEVLARTCYETSTFHPGVSFKVYDDLRYIQVIVAKDAPPSVIALDTAEGNSKSADSDSTALNDTASSDTASSSTASSDTASSDTPPALAPAEVATKWRYAVDEESGKTYFFHEETHEVAWELPLGKVADELEVDA